VQGDVKTVSEKIQLSSAPTHALIRECNRTFDTHSQELLLVALGRALHDLTGHQEIAVTVEGHGREFIDPTIDVSQTVGWFTTMYPLTIECDEDLGRSIHNMRQSLRSVPNQGIGYGSTYGYVVPQLPEVSFNFLGHLGQSRSTATAWQPEPAMNGDYGLCQSPIDAAANRATIDVTAWVVDAQLHVELSSHLTCRETKVLLSQMEHALDEIIKLSSDVPTEASTGGTCEKPTSPERSFIPFFEFTEAPP
jgi:N-(5-amino-5-carboxypentanoyl)-L-cysteinyl-D-valine synthase